MVDDAHVPMHLGLDFLLPTGAEVRYKKRVLHLEFAEDGIIDVPVLLQLRSSTLDTDEDKDREQTILVYYMTRLLLHPLTLKMSTSIQDSHWTRNPSYLMS